MNNVLNNIDQFFIEVSSSPDPLVPPGHMRIEKFRDILEFSDPHNGRAGINSMLSKGCGLPVENILMMEAQNDCFPVENFKNNLKKSVLKKSGKSINQVVI